MIRTQVRPGPSDVLGVVAMSSVEVGYSAFRYLRVCLGSEDGDPGMTLYEVDETGWVHRQVQLTADGTRFAPEDILMCQPVRLEAMCAHPAAEEIDEEDFELLWVELAQARSFRRRVPDPNMSWEGWVEHRDEQLHVMWLPHATPPVGWVPVNGFSSLFVRGDMSAARAAAIVLFIERPVNWSTLAAAA